MFKKIVITSAALMLLTACLNDESKDNNDANNQVSTKTEVNTTNESAVNANVDITNPTVSMKEAVDTFLEAYPDANIESIDLDSGFGGLHYKIDGFDSANEYAAVIDAETKEMKVNEVEANRDREEALDFSNIIEPNEAIEKASAKDEVNGFTPTGWSLEVENGKSQYSIEYKKNADEIEIKVDATTGEILKVEMND
ncbi:PepSY domain-containing protein [Anoxybacillus sp. FSL W8-1294]|uniref:PepSY domain-containing protein n=1 Tax=Anoxybacillus sp. FSL W8-1294 TaxID=2954655 RepID=UPI0030CD95D9